MIGYVQSCGSNGCFIKVANDVTIRANLKELHDSEKEMYPGRPVLSKIISISGVKDYEELNSVTKVSQVKLNGTLKEHVIKYNIVE